MDDNLNGGLYAQNEAWLQLNLAGESQVDLTSGGRNSATRPTPRTACIFSDNGGASFAKVYDLTNGTATYQQIVLDVDALAAGATASSLTSTFVVKFQQYDNYGITTDGMAFDDISVMFTRRAAGC